LTIPWSTHSIAASSVNGAKSYAKARGKTSIFARPFNWVERFFPKNLYRVAMMKRSKTIISQALLTLKQNLETTGDPLGFKQAYWNNWVKELNLPSEGETILLTARMYQMLPYVIETTRTVSGVRSIIGIKGVGKMLTVANRLAGERIIRLKARKDKKIEQKAENALKGIVAALNAIGKQVAYLYDAEPYSGVLLFDLGLRKHIEHHVRKVYCFLKNLGIGHVITVDPHTTFMMREIYPQYIESYDIEIKHYLEILSENRGNLVSASRREFAKEFVIHDSCVMTRDLGIIKQTRDVATSLGIRLIEPKHTRLDTACCGGPIEYAFPNLTDQISFIRVKELANVCTEIIVTCPICLANLSKYQKTLGVRVWDMGEILHAAFNIHS